MCFNHLSPTQCVVCITDGVHFPLNLNSIVYIGLHDIRIGDIRMTYREINLS